MELFIGFYLISPKPAGTLIDLNLSFSKKDLGEDVAVLSAIKTDFLFDCTSYARTDLYFLILLLPNFFSTFVCYYSLMLIAASGYTGSDSS